MRGMAKWFGLVVALSVLSVLPLSAYHARGGSSRMDTKVQEQKIPLQFGRQIFFDVNVDKNRQTSDTVTEFVNKIYSKYEITKEQAKGVVLAASSIVEYIKKEGVNVQELKAEVLKDKNLPRLRFCKLKHITKHSNNIAGLFLRHT